MKIFAFVFVFFGFVTVFADDSKGWDLIEDSDKLKLYTREYPDSEIKEVKAVAFMSGTIKEAVAVMFDRLEHPRIFKYIKHSEVVKKTDTCDWSYNVIDAPLASDRDYLVKSCEIKNSDGSVTVDWVPFADPKYPVHDKRVRVVINKGYWKFTQIKPDELRIDYYIYTDPAGRLPLWIKNLANRKAVPDTIWSLHSEMMDRRKTSK